MPTLKPGRPIASPVRQVELPMMPTASDDRLAALAGCQRGPAVRAMVVDREPAALLRAEDADLAAFDEEDLRRADADVVRRSQRELFGVRSQHFERAS